MNTADFLEIMLAVLFIGCFITMSFLYKELLEIQASNQMLLYGMSETGSIVGGYYDPQGKFYCVDAKQTKEKINQTEYHEYCHYLIDEERMHFCGE